MKKFILSLCLVFTAVLLFSSCAWAAMSGPEVSPLRGQVRSNEDFVNFCCYSSPEDVERAIKDGANANARSENGTTALYAAVSESDSPEVVKILLENGAGVNAMNEEGRTPLHIACYRNSIPVITMLLDAGADINARANGDDDGFTPLISATEHPRVKTMAFLLDRGADISARDSYGVTAFWYAAIYDFGDEFANISVLQLLLGRGAEINARDKEGKTVLTAASEFQPPEVIAFLRDHGAAE